MVVQRAGWSHNAGSFALFLTAELHKIVSYCCVSMQATKQSTIVESQIRGVASMTVNVKGSLRQICKTTRRISTNLSYLRNAMSLELQGHRIPMAKVSFGSLATNAYYTVLLGYQSVSGSVSESGLALAWVIAADLKRQQRPELEGCQPRAWAGQAALGRALPQRSPCFFPPEKFWWRNQKTLFPTIDPIFHTAFFNVEF